MPIQRPVSKPVKPILKPAIPKANVVVRKPAAQASPWSPPGVAGAGGMNRNYLGAPMLPFKQPTGRIPGTFPSIAPPMATPSPTPTALGYDQRNGPSIFPAIPTVPGPAAPPPGWGPSGGALGQFLKSLGLIK